MRLLPIRPRQPAALLSFRHRPRAASPSTTTRTSSPRPRACAARLREEPQSLPAAAAGEPPAAAAQVLRQGHGKGPPGPGAALRPLQRPHVAAAAVQLRIRVRRRLPPQRVHVLAACLVPHVTPPLHPTNPSPTANPRLVCAAVPPHERSRVNPVSRCPALPRLRHRMRPRSPQGQPCSTPHPRTPVHPPPSAPHARRLLPPAALRRLPHRSAPVAMALHRRLRIRALTRGSIAVPSSVPVPGYGVAVHRRRARSSCRSPRMPSSPLPTVSEVAAEADVFKAGGQLPLRIGVVPVLQVRLAGHAGRAVVAVRVGVGVPSRLPRREGPLQVLLLAPRVLSAAAVAHLVLCACIHVPYTVIFRTGLQVQSGLACATRPASAFPRHPAPQLASQTPLPTGV